MQKHTKDWKYRKVREHCHYTGEYRGAGNSINNLKYSVTKENPADFRNGSNYDYYFIIENLTEELEN